MSTEGDDEVRSVIGAMGRCYINLFEKPIG